MANGMLVPEEEENPLQGTQLKSALDVVRHKEPDLTAESRDLGQKLGMDTETIEGNIDDARKDANTDAFQEQFPQKDYGYTYKFLTSDPEVTAIAQDDGANLAPIEKTLRNRPPLAQDPTLVDSMFRSYYQSNRANSFQQALGAFAQKKAMADPTQWDQEEQRRQDRVEAAQAGELGGLPGRGGSGYLAAFESRHNVEHKLKTMETHLEKFQRYSNAMKQYPGNEEIAALMEEEDWLGVLTTPRLIPTLIAENSYPMAKGMVFMLLARAGGMGVSGGALASGNAEFSEEYAQTYMEVMQEGGVDFDSHESLTAGFNNEELTADAHGQAKRKGLVVGAFGAASAAAEGVFFPFKNKLSNIFLHMFGTEPIAEGLGEGVGSFAKKGDIEDVNPAEMAAEALTGAGMAVPQAAIQTKGQFKLAQVKNDFNKAAAAEADAETFMTLGQQVKNSKLFGRSKELLGEFVEGASENPNVYVDSNGLREYIGTMDDPIAVEELLVSLGVPDAEAAATLGDVEVPLGKLVGLADTEHFDALVQHTRKDSGAMTAVEAGKVKEQADAYKQAAEDLIDAGDIENEIVLEADAMAAQLAQDLVETGFTLEEAQSAVQMHRDFAILLAHDTGKPPSEALGEIRARRTEEAAADSPFAGRKAKVKPLTAKEAGLPTTGQKDGRQFKDFFSSVVQGLSGVSDTGVAYEAVIQGRDDLADFAIDYAQHRGNFDDHISLSIPGFKEVQMAVGNAVAGVYGPDASFLDIGASEGSLGKTITARGGPKTTSLDPNPDMASAFATKSTVPGARYAMAAFSGRDSEGQFLWNESGTPVLGFQPTEKFDVVHEAMTFQFIENDRVNQVARVKQLLKEDGVAIFEEKLHNKDWDANETKKNEFKSQFFNAKDMTEKAREILEGMNENMAQQSDFEAVLGDNFQYVAQFWDSGNFKGYLASDDPAKLQQLLTSIGDTTSDFSTPTVADEYTIDQFKDEFYSTTLRMVTGVTTTVQRENGDVYSVVRGKDGEYRFAVPHKLITTFGQSASLRSRKETLKRFGLDPWGSHNVRDVATALEARQRVKYGKTEIGDYSEAAEKKIAKWIVDEVKFELEHPERSGLKWYSEKWQQALNVFSEKFEELADNKDARDLVSALVAITSDGQTVATNFRFAMEMYETYRNEGEIDYNSFTGGAESNTSMKANMKWLNDSIKDIGLPETIALLFEAKTVKELSAQAREMKIPFKSGFNVKAFLPFAGVVFGPKLGSFFGNLMGAEGYLTMDRWWSRTFNRYRGTLLKSPTASSITTFRNFLEEAGVDTTQMDKQAIIEASVPYATSYEARGFKNGSEMEIAANTVYKPAFQEINDTPQNASDREFMVNTVNRAVKSLKRAKIDISVADLQAVLWYYEKRLYGELGTRQSADISYLESARDAIDGRDDPVGTVYAMTPEGQEIAIKPSQQDAAINLEVAPNPHDTKLTRTWDALKPKAKLDLTKEIFEDHVRPLLKRMGISAPKVQYGSGGYGDSVNPSILLRIPRASFEELREIGAILGQVTSQEAIVAFDESQTGPGSTLHAVVKPKQKLNAVKQKELYDALRQKVPGIEGFDWRKSSMIIGDFTGQGPEFADNIVKALEEIGGDFEVVTKSFKSELVEVADASNPERSPIRRKALRGKRLADFELRDTQNRITSAVRESLAVTVYNQAPRVQTEPASLSAHTGGRLRVDPEGMVPLTHWGAPGLTALDPTQHGTGAKGDEASRDGRTPRTYFGLPGYAVEPGVATTAKNRYFARVPATSLYDYKADTDGLMEAIDPNLSPTERLTAYENAIHAAGYQGFWSQTIGGPVAAMFAKVEGLKPLPLRAKHKRSGTPQGLAGYDAAGAALEDLVLGQPALHGSPAENIDTFSTDFINATAFGWGIYFTTGKDVAEFYRTVVPAAGSVTGFNVDGVVLKFVDLTEAQTIALDAVKSAGLPGAIKQFEEALQPQPSGVPVSDELVLGLLPPTLGLTAKEDAIQALAYMKTLPAGVTVTLEGVGDQGRIYEVDLDVTEENLIHQDKPLDAQNPEVLARLAALDLQWWSVTDGNVSQRFSTRDEAAAFSGREQNIPPVPIPPQTGREVYTILSARMGGDREASLRLREIGIRGMKYEVDGGRDRETPWVTPADASSAVRNVVQQVNQHNATRLRKNRIESPSTLLAWTFTNQPAAFDDVAAALETGDLVTEEGDVNFVIFDGADVSIPPLPQAKNTEERRAEIVFKHHADRVDAEIRMKAAADMSSFLHESAHFFLETMRMHYDTSDKVKEMLDGITSWMGLDNHNQIMSDHHELFARTFEAYLREGKAPTASLRQSFALFKGWLLTTYRRQQDIDPEDVETPLNLSPDITQIFDRLLDSQGAMNVATMTLGQTPLFEKPEDGQMTTAEFEAYIKQATQADRTNREKLDAQVVKLEMDKLSEAYAAEIDAEADIQADILRDTNDYRALSTLRSNRDLKLDRDQVRDEYGEDVLAALPSGRQGVLRTYKADETAADLEYTADQLGYSSADMMIERLTSLAPLQEVARQKATEIVDARHAGTLSTPEGLLAAAQEAVMSTSKADLLYLELKALDTLSGAVGIPKQVLKAQAERLVSEMTFAEMRPGRYLAASVRFAREAEKQLAVKDTELAAEAKRKQILNHYMYMKTRDGRRKVGNLNRYFKKFDRPGVRENIDQAYLEQIDTILENFEFREVSVKDRERRQSFAKWLEAAAAAGDEIVADTKLLEQAQLTNYKDLTLDQLRTLSDSVKNIETLGRLKTKLLNQQTAREFEALRAEMVQSLEDNNDWDTVAQDRNDGVFHAIGKWVHKAHVGLLNFEFIFHRLDGNKQGIMYDTFWKPISNAQDIAARRKIETTEKLRGLFEKAGIVQKRGRPNPLNKKIYFHRLGESLSLERRLAVALNWGNENNRQRVRDGKLSKDATQWEDYQIDAILNSLTREQWQLVQDIWDMLNRDFWPEIQAMEKELTGVTPEKVEPTSVQTNFGTLRGGYYPLVYDTDVDTNAMKHAEHANVKEMMGGNWAKAHTRKGHTETRLEHLDKAIRTDLGVLNEHLDNVILDLTHRKPILDVVKLMADREIQDAIKATAGINVFKQINPWLQWVAGSYKNNQLLSAWDKLLKRTRIGASVVGIGFRLSTALVNFTGIFPALTEIRNPGALLQHIGTAAASPKRTWQFIVDRSTYMRDRQKTFDREVSEQIKGKSLLPLWYWPIAKVDQLVTTPTWMAAYEKGLKDNDNQEQAAIDYADFVIRTTMSSGRPADLAQIQRDSELSKFVTLFFSYFDMIYNRYDKTYRKATDGKKMEALGDTVALWILPAILGQLIAGRGPGPEADEPEDWLKWGTKESLAYLTAAVPVARDFISPALSGFTYKFTPAAGGFEAVSRVGQVAFKADATLVEKVSAARRPALVAAGAFAHLPAGQLNKIIDHLEDVVVDNEDFNPWYMMMGKPKGE